MEYSKYFAIFLLVVSVIIFSLYVLLCWPYTVDDAFIAFRYAENLALGHGPVFNTGQPPAEGYTSFLWVFIMVIPHFFRVESVYFAKCAGILATVAYQFVAFKFVTRFSDARNKWDRYVAASMVVLMLSAWRGTAVHAIAGMETSLYTLVITVFFFLIVKYLSFPTRRLTTLISLVGLVLGLTRPEGNLVVVTGLATTLILLPTEWKGTLIKRTVLFYVLPGCAYFIWRAIYYGQLFPLPFYLKVVHTGIFPGLAYVTNLLRHHYLHVGIFVLLGLLKSNRKFLPLFASCISFTVFFCFTKPLMGYEYRFLFPIFPFVFIMAAMGISVLQELFRSFADTVPRTRLLSTLIFSTICLLIPVNIILTSRTKNLAKERRGGGLVNYYKGLDKAHIALGKKLYTLRGNKHIPVLAIGDAGAVPYYSKWRTIDIFGLNDAHIAISGEHDPEYVMSQHPDLVVLQSRDKDKMNIRSSVQWSHDLYNRCMQKGMIKVATMEFSSKYYLWVMAIPGSPIARELEDWKQ